MLVQDFSELSSARSKLIQDSTDEVQKRYSLFYLIGCVASALSGILAFGFSQMKPLQGLNGWQWIFIMQAVLTFIIGILCMIFVVDFPDRAFKAWGFLNEKECAFVLRRLNRDRADADPEPFSLGKFLRPALDLKIWAFAFIFLSVFPDLPSSSPYLTPATVP